MRAALYARYSTSMQSESSIDDQLRTCERLAERHGFTVTARFSDAAISGGTTERPGYQALLEAARRGEFDVIVAEDTSRLWRNLGEQAPRINELQDLGIVVVTHNLDTRSESADILGAVNGAMAETYRKEIARRTRRGLEGRALQRKSTGGKAYGYIPATESGSGQREIHPEQADTVRLIFALYADGHSPKGIADELNRRGIPSPGTTWDRETRRCRGWVASAIHGDVKRGTGILNNEAYVGRIIWNRSRWTRSAADSSRRKSKVNPQSEWIVHQDDRLRIVPQDLWDRAKARQQAQTQRIGARVAEGISREGARRTGRGPKFLFSGLLKCGTCGANFVMADRKAYACGGRLYGGSHLCSNDVRIDRSVVEAGLLAGIKDRLLTPDVVQEVIRQARQMLEADSRKAKDTGQRRAELEAKLANLADAIESGALKMSPILTERFNRTQAELDQLQRVQDRPVEKVTKLVPRLADQYRALVTDLENNLAEQNIPRARAELRKILGEIRVTATQEEILFAHEKGRLEAALIAARGQQISVVAGVGFEPTTFGL